MLSTEGVEKGLVSLGVDGLADAPADARRNPGDHFEDARGGAEGGWARAGPTCSRDRRLPGGDGG
eukprot:9011534-Pyramimonas_sp.AAC.1